MVMSRKDIIESCRKGAEIAALPSDRTPDPDVISFYYVKGDKLYKRPVRTERGVQVGFHVCTAAENVDPEELCAILNKGEPAT